MRKLNIGKIKGIFFLLVMVFGFASMKGEDNRSTKEKIMEIKLNDDFIFGEGVSDDKEIAYGIAMEDLLIFANELKDRNSQEKLSISDLLTKVETLVNENGARFEVVVYIPLKIVLETERKDSSARSGIRITKPGFEIAEDEPEIEEEEVLIADNQATEVIMVEEEPVAALSPEIEKIEQVAPVEETVIVESIEEPVQEIPVEEEILVEETVSVAPVEEVQKEEEPIIAEAQPVKTVETTTVEIQQPKISSDFSGEVEDFLLTQDTFSEIKSFLSDMKRNGKIKETGAKDTLTGLPEDASLILIDEMGGILAVLSPATPQGRINYRTHKSDSVNNYNSKFIVWYKK